MDSKFKCVFADLATSGGSPVSAPQRRSIKEVDAEASNRNSKYSYGLNEENSSTEQFLVKTQNNCFKNSKDTDGSSQLNSDAGDSKLSSLDTLRFTANSIDSDSAKTVNETSVSSSTAANQYSDTSVSTFLFSLSHSLTPLFFHRWKAN